jgi:hypothetical protein
MPPWQLEKPALHGGLVGAEVVAQRLEDAPVVHRVDVAADDGRQRTHARTAVGVGRQQRRRGVAFLQPFDDRRRLDHHAVVELQRRHQALRVQRLVGGAEVLLGAQVDRHRLVGQAFQVERDAQPVRGAAAEEAVQLHAALTPPGRWSARSRPRPRCGRRARRRHHRAHAFGRAGVDQVARLQVVVGATGWRSSSGMLQISLSRSTAASTTPFTLQLQRALGWPMARASAPPRSSPSPARSPCPGPRGGPCRAP